jgi:hypothetical protein
MYKSPGGKAAIRTIDAVEYDIHNYRWNLISNYGLNRYVSTLDNFPSSSCMYPPRTFRLT